jgi:hypothetical protein
VQSSYLKPDKLAIVPVQREWLQIIQGGTQQFAVTSTKGMIFS